MNTREIKMLSNVLKGRRLVSMNNDVSLPSVL